MKVTTLSSLQHQFWLCIHESTVTCNVWTIPLLDVKPWYHAVRNTLGQRAVKCCRFPSSSFNRVSSACTQGYLSTTTNSHPCTAKHKAKLFTFQTQSLIWVWQRRLCKSPLFSGLFNAVALLSSIPKDNFQCSWVKTWETLCRPWKTPKPLTYVELRDYFTLFEIMRAEDTE